MNIRKKIEEIVKNTSSIMMNKSKDLGIEQKDGIGNIVTKYDKEVQDKLYDELRNIVDNPSFIGEESDLNNNISDNGYTFIIDPIDGTTNFSRELGLSVISVALFKDGNPYIGVVYNPYRDEMFSAEIGKGAYLNDEIIKVSNKSIKDGISFIGLSPYYEDIRNNSLDIQKKLALVSADYRRLGSAALEMCYVAASRGEIFIELRLQPWDYAAAYVIAKEAGATITTISGNDVKFDKASSILVTNGIDDILNIINN